MAKANIPRPTTNPLEDDDFEPAGRTGGAIDVDDIEDVDLQRGMPARNLRNIAVGLLAAGLLAYVLWPDSTSVKKPDVNEVVQGGNLVDDLVNDLQDSPRPVSLPEFPETPLPTVAEVPPVDERIELALLSPMAATDVDLRNAGVAGRATASQADPRAAVERLISDQRETRDKALGQQAELLERIASNGAPGGGGFPGVSNASGGMVPGARDSHKQFLAENRGDGGIGSADQLQPARTAATLYEGTLIRTVLTRPINSELPGMVTAVVSTDLYDSVSQRILLVPRGSEITCTYDSNLLVGQEAILAACTRMRLPNGKSFSLAGAPAGSEAGASGLPADINNHFWRMFGTALVVGASSYLLPSDDRNITVVSGADGARQVGGNILGTALSQVIQSTIARNVQIPPTGTVDIGTPFTLTLTKDVEMEPYLASQRGGVR